MKDHLSEAVANLLIFLATFAITTGACAKKAVTCGAEVRNQPAEVRSP